MHQPATTGFLHAPDPAVLILRGDDAGEFLNGQVTNDVGGLTDGESKYALLLSPKGKLRADMVVARDGDETLVVSDLEHLGAIRQTIDTFRIGYFFSTEDATGERALIRLLGNAPGAASLTTPVVELTSPLGIDYLVEQSDTAAVLAELATHDIPQLTAADFEAARVASGVPAFGSELDENTFPAEAALEERAVDFEKGCYVGQETVARMHYKGKPNRHLRQLRAAAPLERGATVTAQDGRELGRIGTTVTDDNGNSTAMAILRREAEPGESVDAGGVPATIVQFETKITAD